MQPEAPSCGPGVCLSLDIFEPIPTYHLKWERCPSWPKGRDWKSCIRPKGVSWVRIPLSPPSFAKAMEIKV